MKIYRGKKAPQKRPDRLRPLIGLLVELLRYSEALNTGWLK